MFVCDHDGYLIYVTVASKWSTATADVVPQSPCLSGHFLGGGDEVNRLFLVAFQPDS